MASEASTTHTEYAHIVRTPGLLGGEARIEGHRIRVLDVVAARDRGGMTPEEIAATVYPGLTLAQVYAALAYYEFRRASSFGRWTQGRKHGPVPLAVPQADHQPPNTGRRVFAGG